MESILWALDLIAVTFLCLWALRRDTLPQEKPEKQGQPGAKDKRRA